MGKFYLLTTGHNRSGFGNAFTSAVEDISSGKLSPNAPCQAIFVADSIFDHENLKKALSHFSIGVPVYYAVNFDDAQQLIRRFDWGKKTVAIYFDASTVSPEKILGLTKLIPEKARKAIKIFPDITTDDKLAGYLQEKQRKKEEAQAEARKRFPGLKGAMSISRIGNAAMSFEYRPSGGGVIMGDIDEVHLCQDMADFIKALQAAKI